MLVRIAIAAWLLILAASPAFADFEQSKGWFESLNEERRIELQLDLTILADYDGLIDAKFGRGTYEAILRFQAEMRAEATGILSDTQIASATAITRRQLQSWGLEPVTDTASNSTFLLPKKLMPNQSLTESGTLYLTPDGEIALATFRQSLEGATFNDFYEFVAADKDATVTYARFRETFFVVSGDLEGRGFYTYVLLDGSDVVGFQVAWHQESKSLGKKVALLLASNFSPKDDGSSDNAIEGKESETPPAVSGTTVGAFFLPDATPDTIRLVGDITSSTPLEFIRALRERRDATVLELASDGGLVAPALILAHDVYSRGLSTRIPAAQRCFSACAFVFLAGQQRTADGTLGVHQVWNETNDLVAGQTALSDVLEAMADFDVDQRVISVMLRTKPEDMHVFTKEEIQRFGIETDQAVLEKGNERLAVAPTPSNDAAVDPAQTAGSQSLLLEASDDGTTGAVPFSGTVEWSRGTDEVGQPTLVGKANIPARNLSVDVLIRKNSDPSLPASHLMEINFNVSETFVGGSITQLPGILLKNEELVQGTPLVGDASRVTTNSFLFALSGSKADVDTNQQLLGRRWMDLALIYGTGKRAILTLEKDAEASALLRSVFAEWVKLGKNSGRETLPDYLVGRWEESPPNCSSEEPISGEAVFFQRLESGDAIDFFNWESEGGRCDVTGITGSLPNLRIFAQCGIEENPKEPAEIQIYVGSNRRSMTLSFPGFGISSTDYVRC